MIASRSFHVLANFTFIRFNPVSNGQLGLEFVVQMYDSGYQVLKHKHESVESGYHRYAKVRHRSTVVCGGIVNDNRGEQIVVLVGNLQIGGTHDRRVDLDYLPISSDINHVQTIEGSR